MAKALIEAKIKEKEQEDSHKVKGGGVVLFDNKFNSWSRSLDLCPSLLQGAVTHRDYP
jgi:hypothetical protein